MPAIFLLRSDSSASCELTACGAHTQGSLVSHGVAAIPSLAVSASGKAGRSSEPDYTSGLPLKYRNEKGPRETDTHFCAQPRGLQMELSATRMKAKQRGR